MEANHSIIQDLFSFEPEHRDMFRGGAGGSLKTLLGFAVLKMVLTAAAINLPIPSGSVCIPTKVESFLSAFIGINDYYYGCDYYCVIICYIIILCFVICLRRLCRAYKRRQRGGQRIVSLDVNSFLFKIIDTTNSFTFI